MGVYGTVDPSRLYVELSAKYKPIVSKVKVMNNIPLEPVELNSNMLSDKQRVSRKLLDQIFWPVTFVDKNIDDFWSNVRRSTQSSTVVSNCIDDVSEGVHKLNF